MLRCLTDSGDNNRQRLGVELAAVGFFSDGTTRLMDAAFQIFRASCVMQDERADVRCLGRMVKSHYTVSKKNYPQIGWLNPKPPPSFLDMT